MLSLRDANKELKRVNMDSGLEDRASLKEELDEIKEALGRRDNEVAIYLKFLSISLVG